jgi:hypothetical protein
VAPAGLTVGATREAPQLRGASNEQLTKENTRMKTNQQTPGEHQAEISCPTCGSENISADAEAHSYYCYRCAEHFKTGEQIPAREISEAYDIKNVDIRNLLTVVVGTLSNQTGESFDSAISRGKCADEILRRFKNAERLAEALREALTVQRDLRCSNGMFQSSVIRMALAAWEGVQQ